MSTLEPAKRAGLLARLKELLDRIDAINDPTLALSPPALLLLRRLAGLEDETDEELRFALGWLHWHRYRALPPGMGQEDFESARVALAPDFLRVVAVPHALALTQHARDAVERGPLTVASDLWSRIASATEDGFERSTCLGFFASTLYERFQTTGDPRDLDWSIENFQEAWEAQPAGDPRRLTDGCGLAFMVALHLRFATRATAPDLKRSIAVGEELLTELPAVESGHPELLAMLSMLLQIRFDLHGLQVDLDRSVSLCEQAVRTPADDPIQRTAGLLALAEALQTRFGHLEALTDLDRAIHVGEEAVASAPAGHVQHSLCMVGLGIARLLRFGRLGSLTDLDQSITHLQSALNSTPSEHSSRPVIQGNLGLALQLRFEAVGAITDLDASIGLLEEAVTAPETAEHTDRPKALTNLSLALQLRFERVEDPADLDRAVEVGESAVEAMPVRQPDRPACLDTLAGALWARYRRTNTAPDLDKSIARLEEAVEALPADAAGRPKFLDNLATALRSRFKRDGRPTDLDRAIDIGRKALLAARPDDPGRHKHLRNLGSSFHSRFEISGARADLEAAASCFTEASEVTIATPSHRIQAARAASLLWAKAGSVRLAADVAESAVMLLPYVAPRRLERHDQQFMVGEFAGLASEAAALALAVPDASAPDRAERALRVLESGRAVLFSQTLETRSDLTDLRARHPALALRFTDLRQRLDGPSAPPSSTDHIDSLATAIPESDQVHEYRRLLSEQFAALLAEIRALDGFATFALPPDPAELLAEATDGPLVVLNVAGACGDALIVRPDGVIPVPLPGLTTQSVADQVAAFHKALDRCGRKEEVRSAQLDIDRVLRWLWDAVTGPVLDALRVPVRDRESPPLRVWWVPCGPLALLPVHAAGHHSDPSGMPGKRTVLDRVVSSYTPTVRTLHHARQRAGAAVVASDSATASALVVAMPTTPGLPPDKNLDAVWGEVAAIRSAWPDAEVLVEVAADVTGSGTVPTRDKVLARLPHHAVVHFACHGDSDPTDPSQSGLLLHDHDTGRLTVAALRPVNLEKAQLAYLSACRTAITEASELTDESIHLVSAMQLAGFPQVIGTLWQVNDTVAAAMAAEFYGKRSEGPAALVLHRATHRIRARYPRFPFLWAAYVHSGS
ncbi:CHAT domain-containing protein [Streptomyces europaeiscabiei]|uniref:CHAT domain-containing protein n=1 Tax=Streptomyces europaeiscabiei TaxID=146819 RepID=UPI0029A4F551|nr:CHAT domain-containing protein [Streptomyces europaeiscabiei]MDX3775913.1 CHAT domain-containing protein [Streptomyces europaeiscabiei]